MSGDALPPSESCLHNLHRVGDGRHPRPEPADVCRNALGVFHMIDCPLTIGLSCAYYDAAAAPHPAASDLEIEAAREEMQRDFLGWRYRRRVRWLTKPRNLVPVGIVLESAPEPEEVVPESLAMREPPPAAAAGAPDGTPADASAAAAADPSVPPPPAAPERYPGQRRSEERLAKKKARLAAQAAAAAAAKAARIAAVAASPPPDESGDEPDDGEFGAEIVADEHEDAGPRTVEQVLAALPDAPVVERPQRGPPGRPQGRPSGDGRPRRRRRRGRRGQGSGPGPGPRPDGPRGGPGGGRGPPAG